MRRRDVASAGLRRVSYRKRPLGSAMLGAIASALLLTACGIMHKSGAAIATRWHRIVHRDRHEIVAHYESPADWAVAVPPCGLKTIPRSGMCRGVGHSSTPTTVTGDWAGQIEYAYGWTAFASGAITSSGVATFTGTVGGCGTGTFTYRHTGTWQTTYPHTGTWPRVATYLRT